MIFKVSHNSCKTDSIKCITVFDRKVYTKTLTVCKNVWYEEIQIKLEKTAFVLIVLDLFFKIHFEYVNDSLKTNAG